MPPSLGLQTKKMLIFRFYSVRYTFQESTIDSIPSHGCGATFNVEQILESYLGSSPRVWGDSYQRSSARHHGWFIPTGVGRLSSPCTFVWL